MFCRFVRNEYFCLSMKRIPGIVIRDYAFLGFSFFVFFTLMRPFGLRNSVGDSLWMLQSLGCSCLIFLGALLSEAIVTYLFSLPCDYSREWSYQVHRRLIFYPLLIIFLSWAIGQYFTIIEFGWKNWRYFWMDSDGNFTLEWFLNNFVQDLVWCIFVGIFWYFVTKSRIKEHKIQELLALNDNIESASSECGEKEEAITITGESKDSLQVSPTDILYMESVANYLNIWYFSDGELKQKRIRNTLKNVEENLSGYKFLLHCHRAFLVNTRFITHVEGNAAGCQLHMFSTERTIPVSKANIEALRRSMS